MSFTCLRFIRTHPHIIWFQLNIFSKTQKRTERRSETKMATGVNTPSRVFSRHTSSINQRKLRRSRGYIACIRLLDLYFVFFSNDFLKAYSVFSRKGLPLHLHVASSLKPPSHIYRRPITPLLAINV